MLGFLHKCNNLWCFLVVFCTCYLIETITFTYLITAVSSVERQFHIPSRQSGTLIAASDVGYVLTVVVLAHLGSRGNRARWIGGGCLLISLACFFGALPAFVFPAASTVVYNRQFVNGALSAKSAIGWSVTEGYENMTDIDFTTLKKRASLPFAVCDADTQAVRDAMKHEKCEARSTAEGSNTIGYAMVFVAIAMIGVGHSMPWTLGMPLIDDNVPKKNAPFYFAGVFFLRIMGPVLGFIIGGWANKLYVTLKPPHGLNPTDPGWIGAWWLGFLVVSSALFVPALLLFCFPEIDLKKSLKSARNRQPKSAENGPSPEAAKLTLSETSQDVDKETTKKNDKKLISSIKTELEGFGTSLGECLKSPVYVGSVMGRLFDAFAFKGFFVFQPKYLEHHYGVPQYKTSFYMAMMGTVGFAVGVLLGSVIMRKFKLDGRKAAQYIGVSSLLSSALAFSLISLKCESVNSQVAKKATTLSFGFNTTCNQACNCSDGSLFPVCDVQENIYFSPCHAGCKTVSNVDGEISFNMTDCSCVSNGSAVSKDFCRDNCQTPLNLYIFISILCGIVSGSAVIPGMLMLFRSVPNNLISVALGFSTFLVSLLSTFPSPIVFGSIIDTTCTLWETVCGTKGACQLYNATLIRVRIHVFQAILRVVGLIFDVWVWYFAKGMKLMEEAQDAKEAEDVKNVEQPVEAVIADRNENKLSDAEPSSEKPVHRRSVIVDALETFGSMYDMSADGPSGGLRRFSLT